MLGSRNGEILTSLIHLENLDYLTQILNISGYLNIVYNENSLSHCRLKHFNQVVAKHLSFQMSLIHVTFPK